MVRLRPLLPLFRTLLLGLLALGIVAKPVLADFCNAHALAHLLAEQAESARHHVDSAIEAQSDRDHASGAHQSLHAFDASPAYVEPFPALGVPPARFVSLALPAYRATAPPARRLDSPFRPPIA